MHFPDIPASVIVQLVIGIFGLGVIVERINSIKTVLKLQSARIDRIEKFIDKENA